MGADIGVYISSCGSTYAAFLPLVGSNAPGPIRSLMARSRGPPKAMYSFAGTTIRYPFRFVKACIRMIPSGVCDGKVNDADLDLALFVNPMLPAIGDVLITIDYNPSARTEHSHLRCPKFALQTIGRPRYLRASQPRAPGTVFRLAFCEIIHRNRALCEIITDAPRQRPLL